MQNFKTIKPENFGKNLRMYLYENKISQSAFARSIDMSMSNLNKIVMGRQLPMFEAVVTILNELQLPLEELTKDRT